MRLAPLAAVVALAAACNTPAAQIRRAAERGEVTQALALYREHVRARGASNPDALAEVALVVLERAAASRDRAERDQAFSALSSLGLRAREVFAALRDQPGVVGDRAAAALYDLEGREGEPPARLLLAAGSQDPEQRIAGLAALEGRRNVVGLVAALDSVQPAVRRAAAARLGRMRREGAVLEPLTRHALHDPDEMVRAAAVSALGGQGDAAAGALEQALGDREHLVRHAALGALVRASPARAEAVLSPMLAQSPTPESLEAARVLASRGLGRAAGYILAALEDERPSIRAQAAVAAGALGASHHAELAPHIEDADVEVRLRVGGILARDEAYRERVIRALRPVSRQPDPHVAIRALGVLAEAGDAAAAEPLRGALASPAVNVRRLAVIAWSNLAGTSGDVDPLAPLLDDPDRSVRLMAAAEIVRIAAR
jgi:HEAT repeat protein